jgi:bifunctional N-acetylglucosamine-1-phosphate-uridyltransferase/glucosamine-1-phosphate-acetyltransferase GlmU-like protein
MLLLAAMSPERLTSRLPKVVFQALVGREEVSKVADAERKEEP